MKAQVHRQSQTMIGMYDRRVRPNTAANFRGPQFWALRIPCKVICQFERLSRLDCGANTDINAASATRCFLRAFNAYNAAKCDCGRGSALNPAAELTALPRILAGFTGTACCGEGREGRGREKRETGKGERGREGGEKKGRGDGTGPPIG